MSEILTSSDTTTSPSLPQSSSIQLHHHTMLHPISIVVRFCVSTPLQYTMHQSTQACKFQ